MSGAKGSWRKANRRDTQLAAMDDRAQREDTHFLAERAKALSLGAQRAPSAAQQQAAERVLFAGHTGAAGINFSEYTQISVTRSGLESDQVAAMASFQAVAAALPPFLVRNVALLGYQTPTPIQQHAIPLALAGRDLMCCAQTGSGKTCAFLLPIAAMLAPNGAQQMLPRTVSPQAIVLAPTRELAQQIEVEAQKLLHLSDHTSTCVYGGANPNAQLTQLAKGVTLLVATPGRLQDFVDRGLVALASIRFLVLDEADRMLDMGFEPQIRRIVERSGMPAKAARQTLMFSATFPPDMQKLAADFLRPYVWIGVGKVGSTTKNIEQRIVRAESSKQLKMPLLVDALAKVNGRTLVFVKKKATANWLAKQLRRSPVDGGAGIDAAEIHGDRSQSQREAALARFKDGSIRVLVATDVAARGLDIEQVAHVINFDLGSTKDDFDSYVHRIGRTGRAGHTGIATSFYTPGFDPKNGCGHIARDVVKFLQENSQSVPDWLLALPELAGGAVSGGGGASGGKKDMGFRDVREQRDSVTRPNTARADSRPAADHAQHAPPQARVFGTDFSGRDRRPGRGGGPQGDAVTRPNTARVESKPAADAHANAHPLTSFREHGDRSAAGGQAARAPPGQSTSRGGDAAVVTLGYGGVHVDASAERQVLSRGRGGRGGARREDVGGDARVEAVGGGLGGEEVGRGRGRGGSGGVRGGRGRGSNQDATAGI
jgi:ATP-dependent RNA helicase DDX3X